MYRHLPRVLLALFLGGCLCTHAFAQQQEAPPSVLRFAPGQKEVAVRGTVSGYQTVNYAFDGTPGTDVSVELDYRGKASLYHNVLTPSGATIFNGSMDGARFQATLRERGLYRVRVYLMRNDARRGTRVDFTLRILQSDRQGQPLPPQASRPSFDCRRARGAIESAVCRSRELSKLDGRLDFVYRDALASSSSQRAAEIRRDQHDWLVARDACVRERALERCLSQHYLRRIGQLEPKR